MIELERRIKALEEKVNSLVQVGTVTEVKGGSVRVGLNGKPSHLLPVLFPKTQDDKYQAMPDQGEEVVCLFLPFGLEQGFVLGAVYSGEDAPPAEGSHITTLVLKDGSSMTYDRDAHSLDLTVKDGEVTVKADKVNLDCGGEMGGVITDKSTCPFTGKPHVDASTTVSASK